MTIIDIIAAIFLTAYFGFTIWVINPSRLAKIDGFMKSHLYNCHMYITNEIKKAIAIIQVGQSKATTTNVVMNKKNIINNNAQLTYCFFLRAICHPLKTVKRIIPKKGAVKNRITLNTE